MWLLSISGAVTSMNGRGRSLLGIPADVSGAPVLRDHWPEASRFSLDRAIAAAAAGEAKKFRAFVPGPDGGRCYWETSVSPVFEDNGQVGELLAVSRDVTTAVETQAFLNTVIQMLPAPLLVKNVQDRRFILLNRAAEDLLGVVPDDGLGKTGEELLDPEAAAAMAKAETEVLAAGGTLNLERRSPPRSGRDERYFDVKLLATQDDVGPRHLIYVADDVTERRAAADSLRQALEAAEQANRARNAFLANMSHEIRTPLNGIVAGSDMLARADLPPGTRDLAAMIRSSGEALDRLLSNILEAAATEAHQVRLEAQPFHAGEALRSIAGLFRLSAEQKGLSLELALAPELDRAVAGDEARLNQALAYLVSNAVKFTDRGRVVLEASLAAPGLARFCVRDTGIGFDPAAKARLFDRFRQADESYTRRFDGAGLGLAIAKDLVELMGGTLDCDSREGAGSCFWFEIPLPAQADAAPPPPAQIDVSAPVAGLRVLLADDHPTNRRVVELMLAGVAEVVSVQNGAEAVDAFRGGGFDLVLMDMQMPVMNGLAAVRELRRLEAAQGSARAPIVMLTANARPEHRAASALAGADDHLAKPITAQSLFAALGAAMASPRASAAASRA